MVLASVTCPVNALAAGPLRQCSVADLACLGVRRISLGSQVARVAHGSIRGAMASMLGEGSFAPLLAAASGAEIDALLKRGADDE